MQYCLHSGKLTKFPVQNMHRLQGLSQLKLSKALWNTARHFLQTVDVHSTSLRGKWKDSGFILSIWGTFSKCNGQILTRYIIAVYEFSIDNHFLKTIYIYISRFEVNDLCRHSKILKYFCAYLVAWQATLVMVKTKRKMACRIKKIVYQ